MKPSAPSETAASAPEAGPALLEVRDLRVRFGAKKRGGVVAVDGISFSVDAGQTLGIVGESGSGKTVANLAVMGLLPSGGHVDGGQVVFAGQDLLRLPRRRMRGFRGRRMAMIFQDPMSALNPFLRVETQLVEVVRQHRRLSRAEARTRAAEMLDRVGIAEPMARLRSYPHELSGGMCQRVMIAMMLLETPELLIADEPTTALDVTIQAQILELLRRMQGELGTAIVLITHDMGVIAAAADHVIVMYGGRVVESAPAQRLFDRPSHPYTRDLLRAIPSVEGPRPDRLYAIEGSPPEAAERPPGCAFAPRCELAEERCHREQPPEERCGPDHRVRCFLHEKVRPLTRDSDPNGEDA